MLPHLRRSRPPEPKTLKDLVQLQERSQPKGIVFLMGAGASADAGLPTSAEMLKRLRNSGGADTPLLELLEKGKAFSNIEDLLLTLEVLTAPQDSDLASFVAK